ncbi:helix-turn-helix domain-containing protein [Alicyclobacillus cellulosilyticus]|uniref:helix-turn-helix domain-containing protein n=1 Tax=Alicyclobacillus cellulosilyticus TaxID=1003997 RepID=UPI00227BE178|nr:helix-turn-helix transcriptional regulator [Alicyclobacillus cellulosilyticus]
MRRLRRERGWSQQELSLRTGISTPHISSLERGKRNPSLDYARRLAEALGVPITALIEAMPMTIPKMYKSTDELPPVLQNFILNEASTPYLYAAHRMSYLPREDAEFLTLLIELLVERRHTDFGRSAQPKKPM